MISQHKRDDNWYFVDNTGTFVLENPHRTSYLYFPLVNEAGMMSAITPLLHGDAKTGQNTFLTPPVSVEDLHNSRSARNFWVFVDGVGPWSAAGNSAPQMAHRFVNDDAEQVTLEAGFLWHKVTRDGPQVGLRAGDPPLRALGRQSAGPSPRYLAAPPDHHAHARRAGAPDALV
jgi:cellobiose phosphorylase